MTTASQKCQCGFPTYEQFAAAEGHRFFLLKFIVAFIEHPAVLFVAAPYGLFLFFCFFAGMGLIMETSWHDFFNAIQNLLTIITHPSPFGAMMAVCIVAIPAVAVFAMHREHLRFVRESRTEWLEAYANMVESTSTVVF